MVMADNFCDPAIREVFLAMQFLLRPILALTFGLTAVSAAETLRVAVYDGYAPPEVLAAYTKRVKETLNRDVAVVVTLVNNNDDAYKAIRTGTADVVVMTSNMPKSEKYKVISSKLVTPIDPKDVVGFGTLLPYFQKPSWVSDGETLYGVPII